MRTIDNREEAPLAEWLRREMRDAVHKRRVTQRAVAEAIGESQQNVQRWLSGEVRNPPIDKVDALLQFCGRRLDLNVLPSEAPIMTPGTPAHHQRVLDAVYGAFPVLDERAADTIVSMLQILQGRA